MVVFFPDDLNPKSNANTEVSLNETKTLEFEHLQNVRIHNGPLSGKEGKYLYKKGNKVVLELESMGLMVKAELHHSFIA